MSKKNGLADPTRLKPFDSGDKAMLRVVIETPKGSRNKFAFNPDEHVFELKKVLPSGISAAPSWRAGRAQCTGSYSEPDR